MKTRKFTGLQMLLLLSGMYLAYLVINRATTTTTIGEEICKRMLNEYQHQYVNDNSLKKVIQLCSLQGVTLNDKRFNFKYLKSNLKTFNCPHSWEYLKVPKPLIALASYPGSGNTWTKELIETVSGIHTGSIYTDWNFAGSRICPARGKVFIIKTHLQSSKTNHRDCVDMGVSNLNYSKAILILRNPYDTLLAEFNRQNAVKPEGDTFFNAGEGLAARSLFSSEKWRSFVTSKSSEWKDMALYWIEKFESPTYVLVYERVRKNTILEMYKLMNYVNIKVPFNSLYCLSSNTTGNYHRVKPEWMTKEKLYDKKMRKIVNTMVEQVREKVGLSYNITDDLHSYLLPVD